jgi:ribosomal protein L23
MERDIQELFQIKLHKSKLITEKNNAKSKDYKELNWRVKSDLQKELLKQNIEKYIIKLPIEVNDLIEEEQNEG